MSKEQLFQLLPLPDDGLQQVLEYATTLSKEEAAEHFSNMLGDSPQVIEFISTFNSRRADPKAKPKQKPAAATSTPARAPAPAPAPAPSAAQGSAGDGGVPKHQRGPKKKKPAIHTPPPRQVASFALAPGTVYNKKDQDLEYMAAKPTAFGSRNNLAAPAKSATPPPQPSKPPPSAAGTLVSDLGLPKQKAKSTPVSRTSTPGPSSSSRNAAPTTTKVSITGGVPMHGTSTALADFDQAIRSLEITTNPSHASNKTSTAAERRCNCVATRHPLLEAAPNCLACGKVICLREGLGPCTFCGTPLLTSSEVQTMIRELKASRGREKMALDREAHKRADVASGSTRPFTRPLVDKPDLTVAEAMALQHRDRLLGFQAQNAQRTTVRDEAADFDVTDSGGMWASAEERALALKRQQKLLREMEWNARPEYEKRQQVVSIDLSGRKVFKKMAKVERPVTPEDGDDDKDEGGVALRQPAAGADGNTGQGGAFSKNPLLGALIRPVYEVDNKGKGAELEGRKDRPARWRRVQDDRDDNEGVILDGGVYGRGIAGVEAGGAAGDEPACG
ncbi:hypothetical protein C8A05DRAFT_37572 [Staphylotrichum tortipilum]|uniref:TRIP4/RQT4 C2HC5-type zinc finger domain-containing protein n=1 Tax=Staphylotrichum tortipilum TaxID=2831512 RepID=A0AAN6MDI4_9PEZI|nr:hypothetical protein C8A05DRAFT_37572 [Staphylotrichum longicolle]